MSRAEGGPVEPGREYVVGERGPERIVMTGPGRIIPAGYYAKCGECPKGECDRCDFCIDFEKYAKDEE